MAVEARARGGWRGLVVLPTGFMLAGLALLIGLGIWQLQRLTWKEGLIARITARARAEPIPLDAVLARWARGERDVEYVHVRLEGRFHHDKERHLQAIRHGRPGWEIITPLERADGLIVLVDRGFVPDNLEDPARRAKGQIPGPVALTGLVRVPPAHAGWFTPEAERARNRWYWRDLSGMANSAFAGKGVRVAPFFVDADALPVPGGWPRGGVTRLSLRNKHLEYALTWFGLAAALIGVWALFVRRHLREGR